MQHPMKVMCLDLGVKSKHIHVIRTGAVTGVGNTAETADKALRGAVLMDRLDRDAVCRRGGASRNEVRDLLSASRYRFEWWRVLLRAYVAEEMRR